MDTRTYGFIRAYTLVTSEIIGSYKELYLAQCRQAGKQEANKEERLQVAAAYLLGNTSSHTITEVKQG